jgi:hypothetical protein
MHRSLVIDVFLRRKKLHLATLAEKSIMLGRGEMYGTVTLLCKKRFSVFPSPARKSLTKLSLAGNTLIIPGQREFGK